MAEKLISQVLEQSISKRDHYELELHNLQNYLSNIINSMPSVIVCVDADSKVTQWNKTAEKATGIEADTALGKTLSDVFSQMTSMMQKITESIRTGEIIQEQKRPCRIQNDVYYEDVTIFPLITNGVKEAVIRVDAFCEYGIHSVLFKHDPCTMGFFPFQNHQGNTMAVHRGADGEFVRQTDFKISRRFKQNPGIHES